MQCEEFEECLNVVVDERRRPDCDAELRLHWESCAECRGIALAYDALLDGFYVFAAPEAPSDMGLRVVADLRPEPLLPRHWAMVAGALAAAAGLIFLVVPWKSGLHSSRHDNLQSVAAPVRPSSSPRLMARPPSIVPQLLSIATAKDPYRDLAKETGQGLASVVLYIPGVGGGRGIMDVESDANLDEPAWALQMSEGFKPVADSVAETLDLLLRSLPDLASRS